MIIFLSNFVSPHTIPLCEQLYRQLKEEFVFIETKPMTGERQSLGYSSLQSKPFVVSYECFSKNDVKYQEVIDSADVVLASFGSIDTTLLNERILNNKLTFLMSERLFKKGVFKILDPKFWKTLLFIKKVRNKDFHLLCMGAYVSKDFGLCGFPKAKMWKFGYITNEPVSNTTQERDSRVPNILWVGRMIWWKKPFIILEVAEILKKKGIAFHLDVVGGGKLSTKFESALQKNSAKELITYHGLKKGAEVQNMMHNSDILLCTSNRLEGWGAVINEGMYNKCIVIANRSMGAAPYLIEDGKTGYLYNGNAKVLADTIERAISNLDNGNIGENAYHYIKSNWSPEIASNKFLQLVDGINGLNQTVQEEGICSKA